MVSPPAAPPSLSDPTMDGMTAWKLAPTRVLRWPALATPRAGNHHSRTVTVKILQDQHGLMACTLVYGMKLTREFRGHPRRPSTGHRWMGGEWGRGWGPENGSECAGWSRSPFGQEGGSHPAPWRAMPGHQRRPDPRPSRRTSPSPALRRPARRSDGRSHQHPETSS